MPEVVSDTSPLQYLYQLGLLDLLPQLVGRIIVPQAVVDELEAGGLALELPKGGAVVIIDDAKAREAAGRLGLKLTGTLGVLLDAKRAGLIAPVAPQLDRLDALGFRLAPHTRAAVLKLAGE